MTILSRAITKLTSTRLPLAPQSMFPTGGFGTGVPNGQIAQMEAYGQVGWLYGVVSRIAESVCQAEWHLYQKRGKERKEIDTHPFLDLWASINPFYTREEFLEASQQHLDLPGESFWLVLAGPNSQPYELWLIRPDRIRVIPSREKYIAGYIYQIGSEKIPLEIDDIIHIKRPNPMDPYRGLGPVGALMSDIYSEHQAALWQGQFYKNGAVPGGVIEFPDDLSDPDFEKFVLRWREQHQGVNNAHRVAVLERAKYHEVKYTQRDMQMADTRRLTRDIILHAGYGMPSSIMGITEDVNRANAEAAEVMFGRWVIRPRLVRIRAAVNEHLLPRYGDDLELDFTDPVPANRELNRVEAIEGYGGEILTLNEARRLLGQDDVPDGDTFKERQAPPDFGTEPDEDKEKIIVRLRKAGDPLLTTAEERLENEIQLNWERRLRREANILADILDPDILAMVQSLYLKGGPVQQHIIDSVLKVELSDIDAYSFDWFEKYGDDVIAELSAMFEIASLAAEPGLSVPILQQHAAEYARHRGAQLLKLNGDVSLGSFTRKRVWELVAAAIEEGLSLGQLQNNLRSDLAFSKTRAETIARTESATALGQGAKQASIAQGRDEKHWVTQGGNIEELCAANEAQGWIKIAELFRSGVDTIPQHNRCLVGDTLILAEAVTAYSNRFYDGDVIVLRTASGKKLTCTPNHPILTSQGWIAAGLLEKGSYVISSDSSQRPSLRGHGYHYDVPTGIEDIAETLFRTGQMLSVPVPTTAKDFHGDGAGSQVAIIGANSLLRNSLYTSSVQQGGHIPFSRSIIQRHRLDSLGVEHLTAERDDSARTSSMSRLNLSGTLLDRHAFPLDSLLFRGRSQNPLRLQEASNGETAYPIPLSQDVNRLAGQVFCDKVVQVIRLPFAGHVYNLQTSTEFYLANGIITHNCRCNVRYRTAALHQDEEEEEEKSTTEARCPGCNRLLGKDVTSAQLHCPKCKAHVLFSNGRAKVL